MLNGYIAKMIQAVVFVLLMDLLIPSKQYKKYFDMCAGFIVIIIMLKPIVGVVSKGVSPNLINYSDMNFLDRMDLIAVRDVVGHSDTAIVLYKSELKKKIINMLKEIDINVCNVNIHINEDNKSDEFGKVEKLSVVVRDKGVDLNEEVTLLLSKNLNVEEGRIVVKRLTRDEGQL